MHRLPLFPLPTIVYPGVPMPLHVFEPRYRQLVARCMEGDRRFGMVYHDPDVHGPFLLEPNVVGCVAEIVQVQAITDGRSMILIRGMERFVVRDGIESGTPYYEGLVEEYADEPEDAATLLDRRRHSLELFRTVMERVTRAAEPVPPVDEAGLVSYQIAQWIYIDPAWRQQLLELRSEAARLDQVDTLLNTALEEL